MSSYITFGKYNKLYKYIWFELTTRILDYLLNTFFIEEKTKIYYLKKEPFPKNILVQKVLNYIGMTILSIVLWKYTIKLNKRNKSYINPLISSNYKSSFIKLEYNEHKIDLKEVSCAFYFSIIFLFFLSDELIYVFFIIDLKGLNFWMLEIIFICLISIYIFKISIYNHKRVAIFIILFFSTAMKAISTGFISKMIVIENCIKIINGLYLLEL